MTKVLTILSVTPDYQEFAVPQLKSILRKTGIPLSVLLKHEIDQFPQHEYEINYKSFKNYPFIVLNIPDYQQQEQYLKKAALNGVMVSKFVLLISEGKTYQQMFQTFNKQLIEKYLSDWDKTLICQFYSRNRAIGRTEQKSKIHQILQKMNICGKVNLDTPEIILAIAEDHTWFNKHHQIQSEKTLNKVFFGVELSSNRSISGGAKFNQKYQLSNRIYLGPTTTDNDLAFLMCHQALIDQNSFVLDPFSGTGSLLVPPSHYGCYVFGSDLDIRVLNGYSVGQINKRSKYYSKQKQFQIYTPKIMLNFQQYQLKQPQIFRMDCLKGRFRVKGMFDAIICDPPYGIRAMSRKINSKNKQQKVQEGQLQTINQTQLDQQKTSVLKQQLKQEQEAITTIVQTQSQKIQTNIQQQQPTKTQEQQQIDQKQEHKRSQKRKIRKQKKKQRRDNLSENQKQYKQQIQTKFCNELKTKWSDKPTIQCVTKDQIYNGLLQFSDTYLKEGGYLVFLYPVLEEQKYQGKAEQLPRHPHFQLIDYSEHKLKQGNARILITMRKTQ